MQHGSVYWNRHGEHVLQSLDPKKGLEEQLGEDAFAHPYSPNWQDSSTQRECDQFDEVLGVRRSLRKLRGVRLIMYVCNRFG